MLYIRFQRSLLNLFKAKKPTITMSKLCKKNLGNDNKSVIASANKPNLTLDAVSSKYEILPTPIKSESDKKEYKVIRLENQLIACLIADKSVTVSENDDYSEEETESETESVATSDAETEETSGTDDDTPSSKSDNKEQKMAAAALCIGVGSFSDPKEVPGMAHFLEHMVFMGSEKFPSENDFDSFIKKGGGSDNASTDAETTCFYFECLEKHLYTGLDKFAQFFISPLMKKDAMTREREAIESEFQMSLPSDSSRKEQLLCSLARLDSPVNSFPWGNYVTLRDNIDDDTLYKGVHEFRRRHYSAHRMTLAIQARLPMETLEKYVLDCFGHVPNNGLPRDDFSRFSNDVFDTSQFSKIYYVKPMKDVYQVDLTWALPSLRDKYKSKPHQYVSHLMGDEGRGSLLSYLKKKVWAIATSVGNGDTGMEDNSMYMLFTISITLTEEGRQHLFEVIEAVFSYINLLKKLGPQEWIFDEIKSIQDTSFRFATEVDTSDTVENLSEFMQIYPPEDYIAGSEILYHYDPEAISLITSLLQPKRMNVMLLSQKLPEGLRFDKVEKWFGTEYTDQDIPTNWLTKWEKVEPYTELAVPPPNPYLTKDFGILPKLPDHPEYPQKLIAKPGLELWYRKDQKFDLPLAYYYLHLINPLSIESALSASMLELMFNLIVFSVGEELYPALSADLSYALKVYDTGLMIKVYGYNEKLPVLVEVLSKCLMSFAESFSDNTFDAIKDKLIKYHYNRVLKPSSLEKDVRLNILVNNYWTNVDKYSALRHITIEQIRAFSKDYFSRLYVKALVQGNVSAKTATDTINGFVDVLGYAELPENERPRLSTIQVPTGEKCCRVQAFNKNDANSMITNYYQASDFSIKHSVIIEILMMVIEEPLFDVLRTKEQLGYSVDCSVRDTYGVLGYTVTVNAQATKHTTSFVDDRIEEFLKTVHKLLAKMKGGELDDIKEDLIKTKRCVDVQLKEEVERNWSEIISDDYLFDKVPREIDEIKKVKLEEIRKWWKEHNKLEGRERFRKLSVQIVGYDNVTSKPRTASSHPDDNQASDNAGDLIITFLDQDNTNVAQKKDKDYFIRDISSFRNGLYVFPPIHPK